MQQCRSYPVKVAGTDTRWRCLAYTDESKEQALLAVCDYGRGQVIVNQFAVMDRIGEPLMRRLMTQTVRYVLHEK